jgi:hypothetical protein
MQYTSSQSKTRRQQFSLGTIYNQSPVFQYKYRPIAHDVTAPVTMHLEDKLAIYA